jgi:hypothetical protein
MSSSEPKTTKEASMIRKLTVLCLTAAAVALCQPAKADPGRGSAVLCYVWAHNSTSTAAYSPSAAYSYNIAGRASANIVSRSGIGQYNVTCQGVGGGAFFKQEEAGEVAPENMSTEKVLKLEQGDGIAPQAATSWSFGGHVQVTAYGSENSNYCKVTSWSTGGRDFSAGVRCYTHAGALADTRFDLLFVW